ncbi:MAG: hypothetical protein KKB51_05870 [Candidatus Riflebacteria bacterium]|nr:hypothetical protein [Candidatus Riflebacteria bacterium]
MMALALLLLAVNSASAGSLTPAAAPTDSASAMFTLEDLYNRLNLGTAGSKRSGAFAEHGSSPGSTMHNLNDVMSKTPAVDVSGAADGEVLTGKKYWGLTTDQWGPRVGAMPNVGAQNVMPTTASQTITQGYHDGTGKVAGDTDLVTGNIKAGTTIFGVTGKTEVVDTTSGDAVTGEIFSGKKAWVDGNEVTGTLETKTLSAASDTVAAGYYIATTLSFVDIDLVAGNIRAGVDIFGVVGNSAVVNTASGTATAGELLYTRTAWVNGQEIAGTRLGGVILKAGGSFSAEKRWYDNADGTITDVTTGLVWLKTYLLPTEPSQRHLRTR